MKKTLLIALILTVLVLTSSWGEEKTKEEYADIHDKMFSMIFDLHSEKMGFDRTELICGLGNTMKERGYAVYKGKKYFPDNRGFIIINTNLADE